MSDEQVVRGRLFRAVRVYCGLDLQPVAYAANLDVSHLSKLERGQRPITDPVAERLLRILEVAAAGRERGR